MPTQDTDREELRKNIVVTLYNASDERDNKSVGVAADEVMTLFDSYIEAQRKAAEIEGRIAERDGMQFFDDNGEETHKPYLQYRFIGDGLKLGWDDRTKELQAQKEAMK